MSKTMSFAVVSMFVLMVSALSAVALTDSFLWNQANSAMASARSSSDYAAVSDLYAGMIRNGICNAPVFRNYGTALLMAGANDAAIDAFHRAEIYGGSNSDLTHNLRLAVKSRSTEVSGTSGKELSWTRAPLFWHYKFPLRERIIFSVLCFNLIFMAFSLRRLRLKSLARGLLVAGIIGLILFGSSSIVSFRHLSSQLPVPVYRSQTT